MFNGGNSTVSLEQYYPYLFENLNYTSGGVPKIIHQTWKNNTIPKKWKKSPYMWKKIHPEYKYFLWTDELIRNHIKIFHPDFLEIHDNYEYNIQRADMIRYFILYDFGGIYSDLDLYPIKSIEPYITQGAHLVFSSNSQCITNSFMLSSRNDPFWHTVFDLLKNPDKSIITIFKHFKIMMTTGPMMINKAFNKSKHSVTILPRDLFMSYSTVEEKPRIDLSEAVLLPLYGKSWESFDSRFFNFCFKYRELLIILVTLLIVSMIYGYFYYKQKYFICENTK